jgi:diguanylate cyclase (GGDEF)-like protein
MDDKGDTLITTVPGAVASAEGGSDPSRARYLIVLSGGIPGAMLALADGPNWIGRAPDNALLLADASISRQHACIEIDPGGPAHLTDSGSTNGTFVNGRRLPPGERTELEDGDRVRFGAACVLKYVRPAPCEEAYQREMYERTVRDALTGLYNRSYFMDQVPALTRRAARQNCGIAVLMLDLDHFKPINDTYGHPTGDVVLREVASVLRQCTRADDIVARFGGEEFVVALPTLSLGRAAERAERIRKTLATRRLRIGDKGSLRVTASIGVEFAPPGRPHSPQALISAADLRLYAAKEAGRNCVVCVDPIARRDGTFMLSDGQVPLTREYDSTRDGKYESATRADESGDFAVAPPAASHA